MFVLIALVDERLSLTSLIIENLDKDAFSFSSVTMMIIADLTNASWLSIQSKEVTMTLYEVEFVSSSFLDRLSESIPMSDFQI